MAASDKAVKQMVIILLEFMDVRTALKMTRTMYQKVHGNQSLMQTLYRIVHCLEEDYKDDG